MVRMKHVFKTIFFSFLICSGGGVFSQADTARNPERRLRDCIFFGGELGMQFGTLTFINLSPFAGYKVTERLSLAVGPKYLYYREKIDKATVYSTSMYGGRGFARYNITPALFAHAEYEVLNLETYFNRRENIESIFAGGGFRQRLGERSFLVLSALWNLNYSRYSPYINPVIRVEFIGGL